MGNTNAINMLRECPNCHKKGISLIKVMLWAARCKYCDIKVGINQLWSLVLNILTVLILIAFVYFSYEQFGFVVVLISLAVYIAMVFLVELFGPLVTRARPRN